MTSQLAIVFAGTPDFAVPALEALLNSPHHLAAVFTQPDRPAGRGRQLAQSPVKRVATGAGLPLEQPVSLRSPEVIGRLERYRPDVLVVVAYGLILPPAVLSLPRLGCVNLHASLLPRWRGAAPIQRAIEAGDALTGVSIMVMDEGLDTGPILAQVETPIGPRETAGSLHARLAQLGADALLGSLEALAEGRAERQVQPASGITYATKIRKEEALLDFTQPAGVLDRRIRAFNPWPVAETRLRGAQLRVWEAHAKAAASGHADAPGTVIAVHAGGIEVSTGRGLLVLERVQAAGRKTVSASAFAQATAVIGEVLGT